jgi:hypothetical protein
MKHYKNCHHYLLTGTAIHMQSDCYRSATGGLVPGVGFLVFFAMLTIGLTILIYATGTAEYSQKELYNVADTAARAVVRSAFWDGNQYNPKPSSLSTQQMQMVQQLMKDLGFSTSSADLSVSVSDDGVGDCVVTISDKVPLQTSGILPISNVPMSATAVVPWNLGHPEVAVMLATSVGPVYVPAYRDSLQDASQQPGNQYVGCPPMQQVASATSNSAFPTWNFGARSWFNPRLDGNSWGGGAPGINTVAALFPDSTFTNTGCHWLGFYPYSGYCNPNPQYVNPPSVPYGGPYPYEFQEGPGYGFYW